MLEFLIFFIVASGIVLYIQYQKLPEPPPEYKPRYPAQQNEYDYLDDIYTDTGEGMLEK